METVTRHPSAATVAAVVRTGGRFLGVPWPTTRWWRWIWSLRLPEAALSVWIVAAFIAGLCGLAAGGGGDWRARLCVDAFARRRYMNLAGSTIAGSGSRLAIVALDFPRAAPALALADRLDPHQCRLKIGKELFTAEGPEPAARAGGARLRRVS